MAGKTEEGIVRVRGRQEGSEIIIAVEDDGNGLDPKKLKAKAIDSGIISESDAARLTDSEAFQLIFMPGFSTSEAVTDISGRGVGMNVVKEVTGKLNGHVDISSRLGEGTKFTIKIPSTVGIASAVLINIGEATFAIPSAIVDEVTNIRSDDMYIVNNREVINYRGSVIPIVHLASILKVASDDDGGKRGKYPVLIVEVEKGKMGLLVDRVIERTEVMVSPFRGIMMDSVFVSGATFIGNKLIPILDINGIMNDRAANRDFEGGEIISYSGDEYDLGAEREFIVFELAGEPYGVAFGHLQEIIRNEVDPVGIPGMGDALVGIINLRNSIVPLLDLKTMGLGADDKERRSSKARVLIVGGEGNSLGLLVDGVKEVCRVGDDDMEEVDAGGILNGEFFPFMARAGDEIIKIVDIDKIVNYYRRGENVQ
jgi:two-component system chemotaxis sensor kinase CheA